MNFDEYKTLVQPSDEVLFKDKNSKFYGYAFPVETEKAIKLQLLHLKKQHYSAGHWCYAYRLGKLVDEQVYRANDDGEPNNSAGMPIYGQILAQDLTNVLVVVVRYFGGTKLGVSGLINAYKTTADLALSKSRIVKRTVNQKISIIFDYKNMNKVMRIIKEEDISVLDNKSSLKCEIIISIRLKDVERIKSRFRELHEILLKEI